MNKRIIIRALCFKLLGLFLLVALSACGGGTGGSSNDGFGGTQFASGTIIGFGSIIVNGIEFSRKPGLADDRVKVGFENDASASENGLRIGMTVNIRGTINNATGTGEYESIEFQPELRGPLDANGVDPTAATLTILGRKIQVETNTNFDSVRDLTEINSELLAGRHPELEISGNLDNTTGVLHATRIARKAPDFNALTEKTIQIKGKITTSNAAGGTFSIGSVSVNFSPAALGSNSTIADLGAESVVEVKGILNGNVITASRIEKKKAVDAGVNDSVKLKGTANGGVAGNTFTISGPNGAITVNTAAASFQRGGAAATAAIVTAGTALEIEGILQSDGSVAASQVSLKPEKTVKVEGNAAAGAFNAGTSTLTLNGVPVTLNAATRLLDKSGQALDPNSIASGDHLQIRGMFFSNSGKVTASQVQRTSASDVTFVQGPVTAVASPNLALIGIVSVDTSGVNQITGFGDHRSVTAVKFSGRDTFFAALTSDGFSVVKAKGIMAGTAMNASEVELEQAQ
ncbi:MAG: hypothetical protein H7Y05_12160 [Steroidobacteraceae bacterium]|nr:hypothetical protein [Deltaproteobacteria bacterium]